MEKRIAERIVEQITDVFWSQMVEEFFFEQVEMCFQFVGGFSCECFSSSTWAAGVPPSLDGLALVAL